MVALGGAVGQLIAAGRPFRAPVAHGDDGELRRVNRFHSAPWSQTPPAAVSSDPVAIPLRGCRHAVTLGSGFQLASVLTCGNRNYLVKSKSNVNKAGQMTGAAPTIGSVAEWVESIKRARRQILSSGSVVNAVAILKAVDG